MSKTKKIMIDGKEFIFSEDGVVKDWSLFLIWLVKLSNQYNIKRKTETNPYKQVMLDEQKKSILEMRRSYKIFNDTIGTRKFVTLDDIGRPWRLEIEKVIDNVKEKANKETKNYMQAAYRGKLKVLKQILNQFTKFILEI